MRAEVLLRASAWALVASLAFFGCDDGDADPDMGGMGGEDGTAGMGGGGVGGDVDPDMGDEADVAVDMGMDCECDRGVCNDDGECVDADPCAEDAECLEGNICDEGACVAGCADDAACAAADPNTPLCIEGRCGNCREDDDCFGAGTCDPATSACVEPSPCTDSRECAGDRACLDGSCGERPDCSAEGQACPGGWICQDDGTCAAQRAEVCQGDDECGLGQVCLDGQPRVCGTCRQDEDCPGGQICVSGPDGDRCQETGVCEGDDDCEAGRVCDGGNCAAPACTDDGNEPNDDQAGATALDAGLYLGLTSCNDDWFTFDLPADTTGEIILTQLDRGADLALVAVGPDGNDFARSQGPEVSEGVVVGPFPNARPLFIRVEQVGAPSTASYNLEIALYGDGERCVDDRFDVGGDDDTPATARRVRSPGDAGFPGDLTGRICPGDSDVMCFHVNAREEVEIGVEVLAGNPVIIGELAGADGELFDDTGSWSRDEATDIIARGAGGTWCLRLYTDNDAAGSYAVNISAISPETRSLCRNSEDLPLNGGAVFVEDTLPEASASSAQCANQPADAGERVYNIVVDDPEQAGCFQNPCLLPPVMLTVQVQGLGEGTLGDPVVSLRSTCEDNDSEVACADDSVDPRDPLFPRVNPAIARLPVTEPGSYTLIVDGVDPGDSPDFLLQVDASPLAAVPPNDTCRDAPALDLLGGVAEVTANLGQARDDYTACTGIGGPDVAYAVRLDRTSYVRVQALAQPNDFAVGAYLVADCDNPAPVGCGFGFEGEMPPGDYFLVLDGAGANARGRVTAQVVVEPYPDSPPNETCEDAERLDPAGGDLRGDTRGAGDDYRLVDGNRCTGHNTIGGDVVYRLPRQAEGGYFIEAEPIGGWDLALAVVNSCDDPARERLICSDGALTEAVFFDAPGSDLLVIVDGTNGERGRFDLRWGPADCQLDIDCDPGQACEDYACVDLPD